MKLILLGEPGCGKGTQAEMISKKYGLPILSTGNILRQAVIMENELGKQVKGYLSRGDMVPNELIKDLIREELGGGKYPKGFILDGYPRYTPQEKDLEEVSHIDIVLYITVPEDEVVKRISSRRVCSKCHEPYNLMSKPPKKDGVCDKCGGKLTQREDDSEATILHRLKVYREQTKPLVDYYSKKGVLNKIDGNQPIEKVFSDICGILGE